MFETPDFHSVFKLIDPKTGTQLTDKCAIHFFELKKINKQVNKNNRKELWLQLINAEKAWMPYCNSHKALHDAAQNKAVA